MKYIIMVQINFRTRHQQLLSALIYTVHSGISDWLQKDCRKFATAHSCYVIHSFYLSPFVVAPLRSVSTLSFSISELSYLYFPLSVLFPWTQSDERWYHSTAQICEVHRTTDTLSYKGTATYKCIGRNSNFYICDQRTRGKKGRNAQE
jgi:hypothetical protein